MAKATDNTNATEVQAAASAVPTATESVAATAQPASAAADISPTEEFADAWLTGDEAPIDTDTRSAEAREVVARAHAESNEAQAAYLAEHLKMKDESQ